MSHDPLEEFFARERADLRELPGGPERWDDIVRRSRRPARHTWVPYLAGAAAAAVVVGAMGWNAVDRGNDAAPASASSTRVLPQTATPTVTSSARTLPSTPPPVPSPSTTTSGPLPAPLTFSVVSLTNGGDGHLRALGAATCAGGKPCTSVVGSDDDGRTWTARATFETETAKGMARRTPDRDNQLTGLRFATPDIGYAFGSKAFRSVDGGRRFTPFDVGGRPVLSLEVGGGTVWMVTASKCQHGQGAGVHGCSDLEVWSAPTTATRATRVVALDTPVPADAAWLSMDGADAYVSVSYADPAVQTLPRRVSRTPVELTRPAGCATTGGVWVWGTANTRRGLVAVCRAAKSPDTAYAVATSEDSGATWSTAVPAAGLGTPAPAGVWLTAPDLQRLVAVTRGLPTSSPEPQQPTALLASRDGGSTWAASRTPEGSDGWSWAGAGGGDLVFALGGGGTYAVSADGGASFGQQQFRK